MARGRPEVTYEKATGKYVAEVDGIPVSAFEAGPLEAHLDSVFGKRRRTTTK